MIKIGDKIGHLTVIEKDKEKKTHANNWICECECGKVISVRTSRLNKGQKSCGCKRNYSSLKRVKGLSHSNIYQKWTSMINRCYRENMPNYHSYGGRGIIVCDEWKDKESGFLTFYNWAIKNGYGEDETLTIDRIDVNGNYEPSNCRMISNKLQQNNKRNNHYITYNGETKTAKQWSEYYKIRYPKVLWRLKNGWSFERTFEIN